MKRLLFSISLLLASISGTANTSSHPFVHFRTNEGLTSNTIYCTTQDRFGFIWIGTKDGICRYDGQYIVSMEKNLSADVLGGMATSVFADREGYVWFSTSNGSGYYDTASGELKTIGIDSSRPAEQIACDLDGNVWFVAEKLVRYNRNDEKTTFYDPGRLFNAKQIAVDTFGKVWCISDDGHLFHYDGNSDSFRRDPVDGVNVMAALSGGKLIISTYERKVYVTDPIDFTSTQIFDSRLDGTGRDILCLLERQPGEYWISTEAGIYIHKTGSGITTHIVRDNQDNRSISSSYVTNMNIDREGNIWAGTYYKGLNLWRNMQNSFNLHYPANARGSITGKIVRAITEDSRGNLWIGTEDGGLNLFSPSTGTYRNFDPGVGFINIQDILVDGDYLWISTYGRGMFKYCPETNEVLSQYDFQDNRLLREVFDDNGNVIVGTVDGLYRYNPASDRFISIDTVPSTLFHTLVKDRNGNYWAGTTGMGIWILDKDFNVISNLMQDSGADGALSNNITSFFEDSRGRMWVATEDNGICLIENPQTPEDIRVINTKDGLPTNVICSVIEDNSGYFWITTIRGLSRLNPEDFSITNSYYEASISSGYQYSYGAALKYDNGVLYFGCVDGLVSFDPEALKSVIPNESLYINSVSGIGGTGTTSLTEPGHSIQTSSKLRIRYRDITSSLFISYSVPSYSSILPYLYEYSLKGGSVDVSATTTDNFISFANIGYGKKTFTVHLVGSNSPDATKSITIDVIPPTFISKAAIITYFLLLLVICHFIFKFITRQKKIRRAHQIRKMEQSKQKEIYDSKISFFTNITHEIRTPLSLIKMPLDRIIRDKQYYPDAEDALLSIQANTDRLITLTNQLLDLNKLVNNEEKLDFTRQNICDTVQKTCSRFISMAKEQGTTLNVTLPDHVINMMYARDSVEKILSNLLSNALKYGKDEINVSLKDNGETVEIRVDSNGEHISESEQEKIFEKFYHSGKGTGLGLPFARALAELHDGQLVLDNSVKDFNSFVLTLPVDHPGQIEVPTEADSEIEFIKSEYDSSRKDILLVEDNIEFRNYIVKELSGQFNVFTAPNGKAAIDELGKNKIDIIISDIMMPLMDGCDLCNYVKGNIDFSHIPVILMTAAVGMETHIETLEAGADAYIEKPFPIELLRASISNLFKNKEIANRQFTNSPLSHYNSTSASRMDNDFMDKLHSTILSRMSEPELGIDELAEAMGTSKSTLYRKVKANTGLNINEYIRICRLKQAAEMLSSRQYRINEVAAMVGFSSPSYFASNFQKQFNISPSTFIKSITKQ